MGGGRGVLRHTRREVRVTRVKGDRVSSGRNEEAVLAAGIRHRGEVHRRTTGAHANEGDIDVRDTCLRRITHGAVIGIVEDEAFESAELGKAKIRRGNRFSHRERDGDFLAVGGQHGVVETGIRTTDWRRDMLLIHTHHILARRQVSDAVNAAGVREADSELVFRRIHLVVVVLVEIDADPDIRDTALTRVFDAVVIRIVENEVADAAGVVEAVVHIRAGLQRHERDCPHGGTTAHIIHASRHRALGHIDEVGTRIEAAEQIEAIFRRHRATNEQITAIQCAAAVHIAVKLNAHILDGQLITVEDAVFIRVRVNETTQGGTIRRRRCVNAKVRIVDGRAVGGQSALEGRRGRHDPV